MEIVKAVLNDLNRLQNICIEAYSKNFDTHWNEGGLEWYLDREFNLDRLRNDLLDSSIQYYFILSNENTVGFMKTKANIFFDSSEENFVELEKIYVLPDCKGKGYGKFALLQLIKTLDKNVSKKLFLNVIDSNKSAISFYIKQGFTVHSKTVLELPYFKEELKGMDRMVKQLN